MAGHVSERSQLMLASEPDLPVPQGEQTVSVSRLHAGSALLILAAYVGAQFAGGALAGLAGALAVAVNGYDLSDPDLLASVIQIVTAPAAVVGVLLGGIVLLSLTRYFLPSCPRGGFPEDLGWRSGSWRDLHFGLAGGALLGLGYLVLAEFLAPTRPEDLGGTLAQMASTPGLPRVYWLILVLALAPPFEEFLFRGVLLSGLRRSWGLPAASILVTVLFVAVHLPGTFHYWPAIVAIASVGILALVIRLRTQSLVPAVAVHFAYNLIITLGVYTSALS